MDIMDDFPCSIPDKHRDPRLWALDNLIFEPAVFPSVTVTVFPSSLLPGRRAVDVEHVQRGRDSGVMRPVTRQSAEKDLMDGWQERWLPKSLLHLLHDSVSGSEEDEGDDDRLSTGSVVDSEEEDCRSCNGQESLCGAWSVRCETRSEVGSVDSRESDDEDVEVAASTMASPASLPERASLDTASAPTASPVLLSEVRQTTISLPAIASPVVLSPKTVSPVSPSPLSTQPTTPSATNPPSFIFSPFARSWSPGKGFHLNLPQRILGAPPLVVARRSVPVRTRGEGERET